VPCTGSVLRVKLHLMEAPPGPPDGSGWELCVYKMDKIGTQLSERVSQQIEISMDLAAAAKVQIITLAEPLAVVHGEYIGIQNRHPESPEEWWDCQDCQGALCISLDDNNDTSDQAIYKFSGGMGEEVYTLNEHSRPVYDVSAKLKQRNVGLLVEIIETESEWGIYSDPLIPS